MSISSNATPRKSYSDLFLGAVYVVRTLDDPRVRYVGQTTSSVSERMRKRYSVARSGRKTPLYSWLRSLPDGEAYAEPVEIVETDHQDLGDAEIRWIRQLREQGEDLLNISDGGLGLTGVVWTEEQRKAAGLRAKGRKGVSRFGELNPFLGRTHSDEQRAKWRKSRAGSITGEKNPNYGRSGADHPSYGRKLSLETRTRLSEQKRGDKNPNCGKRMSDEDRRKRSDALLGRPLPHSRRSAHTRHHTNKGVFKDSCEHCLEDLKNLKGKSDD